MTACTEGQVRLAGGSNHTEGRVEVCSSEEWGTVCDGSWGKPDAQVVCRQLGFPSNGIYMHEQDNDCVYITDYCIFLFTSKPIDATALSNAYFGEGIGPIHYADVACSGNEYVLEQCSHRSSSRCSHSQDASVRCFAQGIRKFNVTCIYSCIAESYNIFCVINL